MARVSFGALAFFAGAVSVWAVRWSRTVPPSDGTRAWRKLLGVLALLAVWFPVAGGALRADSAPTGLARIGQIIVLWGVGAAPLIAVTALWLLARRKDLRFPRARVWMLMLAVAVVALGVGVGQMVHRRDVCLARLAWLDWMETQCLSISPVHPGRPPTISAARLRHGKLLTVPEALDEIAQQRRLYQRVVVRPWLPLPAGPSAIVREPKKNSQARFP